MATRNDITGDTIQTKTSSQAYRDNWDAIFGKNKTVNNELTDQRPVYMVNAHGAHAQEKTVFEVDMGDLPAEDVNDYIEKIKKDIDINNK